LYDHAKTKIPGGTQLLSKRPEMLAPGQWPAYFSRAKGCETWDLDGCHYYDMSTNGIGSCLLGFADEDVNKAVIGRIHKGSMCTLNPSEEVELADLLCDLHPWAEKVRYARTGGETCAVAVRIARAATGRSKVAICGYHGWHDWYLACNLGENDGLKGHLLPGLDPVGVPEQLRGSAYTFRYDHPEELEAIIDKHGDELAAVIMEPCRYHEPQAGFLDYVRESTRKCGSLLIFDEITIGFRLGFGGSHLKFGIDPDIAVFAKALGNGFPIGAIIGTGAAMDAAQDSFISSTYWTEAIGPTAALAVVRKIGETKTYEHVNSVGQKIVGYWTEHGKKNGLNLIVGDGYPCLAHFSFDYEEKEALRTLYAQMMLERGFLAGTMIYPTLAHDDKTVDLYGKAISEVFSEIAIIINEGRINESLKGPVAHSGFKRLL
jgi:glutamate-1-semialdehyde 2,1-aminomutase